MRLPIQIHYQGQWLLCVQLRTTQEQDGSMTEVSGKHLNPDPHGTERHLPFTGKQVERRLDAEGVVYLEVLA